MQLGCTVNELLSRISSHELTEWIAYASLEPFGQDTQYLGHAITASTIANVNRAKGTKAFAPKDFMPKFDEPRQTTDQQLSFAALLTEGLGGKVDIKDKSEDG